MIQFYAPDVLSTGILPEGESAHCCRVLRMQVGDTIYVTDGRGRRYTARLLYPHHSKAEVEILSEEKFERGIKVSLAVAPTKSADRMEWLAEKAVELGVSQIVLLKCDRSERKIYKTERLQKVMVSAMKQSLSTYLPIVSEVTSFKEFLKNIPESFQKFFGYCSADYPRKEFVKEYRKENDVVIMIGPEGDFTEREVESAVNSGFIPVTFGDQRMRTETAALYGITAVSVINRI